MSGIFEGIRILEVSQYIAGPTCTMRLADMGAEVIKIETPKVGDVLRTIGSVFKNSESASFLSANRNKKSVTLDIYSERGRKILLKLVEKSDVFIESWRPGVAQSLGLSHEDLSQINPKIIYCSISAFGQTGPYRDKPGIDPLIQALGGIMSITGEEGGTPVMVGAPIADTAGGLMAAFGITLALFAREKSGVGQKVDIPLLDTLISLLTPRDGHYFVTGTSLKPIGSAHRQIAPYQAFKTKDEYIYVAALREKHWERLCQVLGLKKLLSDLRFNTSEIRLKNREVLASIIEGVLNKKTAEEWLGLLEAEDIPCSLISNFVQLFNDPQVLHNQMVIKLNHPKAGEIKVLGIPLKFEKTPGEIHSPPPVLGQHTEEILTKLAGFSPEEVKKLGEEGII